MDATSSRMAAHCSDNNNRCSNFGRRCKEDAYADPASVNGRVPMEDEEAAVEWARDYFSRDDDMDVDNANRQSKRRHL